MTTERLFVYGSLKRGGSNAHVLADVPGDWEPASIRGTLIELGWGAAIGFPGLVLDAEADPVVGHVLTSSALASEWQRLDEFEGSDYRRVQASVTLEDERMVDAFVYVIRESGRELSAPA